MFFVEAQKQQHLVMQNLSICDLSKGRSSFGNALLIWVAECLGGGTGKLAANVLRLCVRWGFPSTKADKKYKF